MSIDVWSLVLYQMIGWQRVSSRYTKDSRKCTNYRGISILGIPGKIYGRLLISGVIEKTKEWVPEEQGGFRSGRGCIDHIFVLKELCMAFMDLKKPYDKVCR